MIRYILKRILQSIPIILLITMICFILINIAPYNAVDSMVTPKMEQAEVDRLKEYYGYNKPFHIRYAKWLRGVLKGEFGYSILTNESVSGSLKTRIPNTMKLVIPSFLSAFFLSLILGLIAGMNKNRFIDKLIDGYCAIGISVPTFWFAILIIYILGYKLELFPLMGMYTIGKEKSFSDFLMHFFMPYIVMTLSFLPGTTRYIRSSTISELKENYVMVQRSFGATKREILFNHIMKNVLIPVVTIFGMAFPMLITGAVITESIFSWPGVGPYFITSVRALDYPVIMSVLVLSSSFVILGNLFSDIMICVVDPRIKRMW